MRTAGSKTSEVGGSNVWTVESDNQMSKLTSCLPSFLNSTEHLAEDWLCCQQMGEFSDQRL